MLGGLPIAAWAEDNPPQGTAVANPFASDPTVAAVFREGLAAGHECTASVVQSPGRNLFIGAAHCFSGATVGVHLVPGYHDGQAPYGVWTVTGAYADPSWITSQDPRRDWVFLSVAPQQRNGRSVNVQDITGGNLLLFKFPAGQQVTVPAYPGGAVQQPITCKARSYSYEGYSAFNCDGYVGGTSGAPFLVATPFGPAVVGVIGGLHQGGCVSWTSYSSPLGMNAWEAYLRASFSGMPDVLPEPGPDGCG